MNYCPQCGKPVLPTDKYCSSCGYDLQSRAEQDLSRLASSTDNLANQVSDSFPGSKRNYSNDGAQVSHSEPDSKSQSLKKHRRVPLAVSLLIFIAAISFLVFVLWKYDYIPNNLTSIPSKFAENFNFISDKKAPEGSDSNSSEKNTDSTISISGERIPDGLLYELYDDHVTITGCDDNSVSLEIPSSIEGKPVTSVDSRTFRNCKLLISVILPESVTAIESSTFFHCESLINVSAKGVTSIGGSAFQGCGSLATILLPPNMTDIGIGAFANCSSLKEFVVPSGVKVIQRGTFDGCKSLATVILPEGVTSIELQAFEYCSSLIRINLPEGLRSIGECAFQECSSLATIAIPKSVSSIGESAFYQCRSLKAVSIPDGVTAIEGATFCDCTSLLSVTIPKSVNSIGNYAFFRCNSLENVFYSGSMAEWNSIVKGESCFPGTPKFQYNQ